MYEIGVLFYKNPEYPYYVFLGTLKLYLVGKLD